MTNGTIESGAAVIALWHDGSWSRDPTTLAGILDVRVTYDCANTSASYGLRGVDALGQVMWTDSDLGFASEEGTGFYVDGPVTVTQACSHRDPTGSCDTHQLVGIDHATGEVRWAVPGLRLVAGDAADGYVLTHAGDVLDGSQPGWTLLDDRTGRSVAGQRCDDPASFNHPCCAEENITTRAAGLVLVVDGEQVRVWYQKGTGGQPRTTILEALS